MMQMLTDAVYFNNIDLNLVPGITLTGFDTFRTPTREVNNYSLAYENSSVTPSAFYTSKKINLRCVITRSTRDSFEQSLDTLRKYIDNREAVLRLPQSGAYRQYTATVSNIGISNVSGGFGEIDIEFLCSDPFGYATSSTTLLSVSGLTSGNKSYPITLNGTAKQLLKFTLTVNSLTSGTAKTVTVSNPTAGTTVTIIRDWAAADVLVVDPITKVVTVAGAPVEFTGNLSEWSPGAGFINYTDNFTARNVDISVIYTERYL